MNLNWQASREKLNHDILCNQVLNEVRSLRQNPCRKPHRLRLWPDRAAEYSRLFDTAEEALSTKRLLDLHFFDCWTQEYKSHFGNLFHELFLLETNIKKKVQDLKILLDRAKAPCESYLALPEGERTEAMVIELQQQLELLSASISKLPVPYIEVK